MPREALPPALFAVLTFAVLTLTGLAGPAYPCVGPPPEPVCGKNLTLALAGPPTTVLTGGDKVDVTALVYFEFLDFPAGLGACPSGPYTVDVAVTASCTPSPGGSGQVLGAVIGQGFNTLAVPVTFPTGPARRCTLDATATVRLADGMVLTATAQNTACVVDPAPGDPTKPVLDLELVGSPGDEIARVHPGDQASRGWRVTNNASLMSFTGSLEVAVENESRLPGASGPMPEGTGVFSISDPVQGDHFPVGFDEDLVDGCLALPPDPLNVAVPMVSRPISLDPGESIVVPVHVRPWGMCADGSCGRVMVSVKGDFDDMSPGLACSGFVTAADTGVPPSYAWPDAGEVGEFPEPDDPSEPSLEIGAEVAPGVAVEVLIEILQATLLANGAPTGAPIVFADRLDPERGRIQLQYLGPFLADTDFDFDGEVLAVHPPTSALVVETAKVALLDGPTGFTTVAPASRVLTRISDPLAGVADSFFDLTFQVSLTGIDTTGVRRPLDFGKIGFVRRPDGSGFDFELGDGFLTGGTGDDLLAIEVAFDLRGFLSPTPQDTAIFTDGFESGNVSAWSLSVP